MVRVGYQYFLQTEQSEGHYNKNISRGSFDVVDRDWAPGMLDECRLDDWKLAVFIGRQGPDYDPLYSNW